MLPSVINLYMIPNLFFSFTVSVSVVLSVLNIPYKSISINLPKYCKHPTPMTIQLHPQCLLGIQGILRIWTFLIFKQV